MDFLAPVTLFQIREIALTFGAVGAAVTGFGGAILIGFKFAKWANARIDRERKVNEMLVEFPGLVKEMNRVGTALMAFASRFDTYVHTATLREEAAALERRVQQQREDAAAKERELQVLERSRVGTLDNEAAR